MIKVPSAWCTYTQKPMNRQAYTDKMNRIYTRFAKGYDGFIKTAPFWTDWLSSVLPYVEGNRLLEISFGPGWLLTRYPGSIKVYGLDYNATMVQRAKAKVLSAGRKAKIVQGNVEALPYPDGIFDTVVNTMAFSGYPDGDLAITEMLRTLKPGGRLLLLDYDYPDDRNIGGWVLMKFMEACGDIMKDIGEILDRQHVSYEHFPVGGFGSVQLFVITKVLPEEGAGTP